MILHICIIFYHWIILNGLVLFFHFCRVPPGVVPYPSSSLQQLLRMQVQRNACWVDGFPSIAVPSGNQTWLAGKCPNWMEVWIGRSLRHGPFSSKPCLITRGYSQSTSNNHWYMEIYLTLLLNLPWSAFDCQGLTPKPELHMVFPMRNLRPWIRWCGEDSDCLSRFWGVGCCSVVNGLHLGVATGAWTPRNTWPPLPMYLEIIWISAGPGKRIRGCWNSPHHFVWYWCQFFRLIGSSRVCYFALDIVDICGYGGTANWRCRSNPMAYLQHILTFAASSADVRWIFDGICCELRQGRTHCCWHWETSLGALWSVPARSSSS